MLSGMMQHKARGQSKLDPFEVTSVEAEVMRQISCAIRHDVNEKVMVN